MSKSDPESHLQSPPTPMSTSRRDSAPPTLASPPPPDPTALQAALTASVTHFFTLSDTITAKELQISMNKYALARNSERPGYTSSPVYGLIIAENDRLAGLVKTLREQRWSHMNDNVENVNWVKELFRMRKVREDERFRGMLVPPDVDTAWEGEERPEGVSEEQARELEAMLGELSLEALGFEEGEEDFGMRG